MISTLGLALALAACGGGGGGGGGSSSATPTTPPVTPPTSAGLALLTGEIYGEGNADGTGDAASFYFPLGLAVDASGNAFVADYYNHTIRKITPSGVVSTFAGKANDSGSENGDLATARFNSPRALVFDSSGNLFVTVGNAAVRKITPAGVVTTFAGGGFGHADGQGTAAKFRDLNGIAIDSANNLYVSDENDFTVRKITPGGLVSTLAGNPGTSGNSDGQGSNATFKVPRGIAVDSHANVYVADTDNHTIRKITPSGVVSTWLGTAGASGNKDANGTAARFANPHHLVFDASDNLYIADSTNNIVRKATPAGEVTTALGSSRYSSADGMGQAAGFSQPRGLARDAAGNLYIADSSNHTIRKATPGGVVTTLAGRAKRDTSKFDPSRVNGTLTAARFDSPRAIAADKSGNLYVTEHSDIRRIASDGTVSTYAGDLEDTGTTDGTGTSARFSSAYGISVTASNHILVTESANNVVRKITPGAVVSTFAGANGSSGTTDATNPGDARFDTLYAVVTDSFGNVFVADRNAHTIRRIDAVTGAVTTFAGVANTSGHAEGTPGLLNLPPSLAIDSANNLYVSSISSIRKITPAGVMTTFAGSDRDQRHLDGTGTNARFTYAHGLAMDGDDNLYVADTDSYTVRKITPAGVVSTIIGTPGVKGFHAGNLPGVIGDVRNITVSGNYLYLVQANGILSAKIK